MPLYKDKRTPKSHIQGTRLKKTSNLSTYQHQFQEAAHTSDFSLQMPGLRGRCGAEWLRHQLLHRVLLQTRELRAGPSGYPASGLTPSSTPPSWTYPRRVFAPSPHVNSRFQYYKPFFFVIELNKHTLT